jgi:NEDD8-activating enzyme E1
MVDWEDPEHTLKPLIDGGTEGNAPEIVVSRFKGFRGQARVIIPTQSSCYECSLDMLGKRTVYPVCTIATTPRLPEHCIEWASVLEWPRLRPSMSPEIVHYLSTQI